MHENVDPNNNVSTKHKNTTRLYLEQKVYNHKILKNILNLLIFSKYSIEVLFFPPGKVYAMCMLPHHSEPLLDV